MRRADNFYDRIRLKIANWAEEKGGETSRKLVDLLLLAPDFFLLLVRLLRDPRVPATAKYGIAGAIAYYFLPLDFLPEILVGPIGFGDDLILAALVINRLLQAAPDIVVEHWSGSGEVLAQVEKILNNVDKLVTNKVWNKIREHWRKISR
ncbi:MULTISPECIES: YkvA family protein [unclassified Carboxydocella]|uniref:YkvA family protein n=1 Tax=unclassified Carboxydocella TaxID=2685367 RepID=UPI0009C6BC4A|nr:MULTISPECIES: DUF1232 domain-containing protein [unclassified Carboxydocella]GAW27442.1 Uncharacterized membrane protein YkvA, DUF1232 family [Carboxydocella sp. ULO1]GAW30328.1 Uncharacterized membrane protein YkvA, DUF1232 family [Carboxydocella sp. JDF658]